MAKIKKRKAPSRIKYEQNHPTISCRVSREIYEQLKAAKKLGSFADILKAGLGPMEAKEKERKELIRLSYETGYKMGYTTAQDLYKVEYRCSRCGEMIAISSNHAKKAAANYMQEDQWGHCECPGARA